MQMPVGPFRLMPAHTWTLMGCLGLENTKNQVHEIHRTNILIVCRGFNRGWQPSRRKLKRLWVSCSRLSRFILIITFCILPGNRSNAKEYTYAWKVGKIKLSEKREINRSRCRQGTNSNLHVWNSDAEWSVPVRSTSESIPGTLRRKGLDFILQSPVRSGPGPVLSAHLILAGTVHTCTCKLYTVYALYRSGRPGNCQTNIFNVSYYYSFLLVHTLKWQRRQPLWLGECVISHAALSHLRANASDNWACMVSFWRPLWILVTN